MEEVLDKKVAAENYARIECLAARERMAQIQADAQKETARAQAKQAEAAQAQAQAAQAQAESFARVM